MTLSRFCLKGKSKKRLFKHLDDGDSHIDIFGSNRWVKLEGTKFRHYNRTYSLGQFMRVRGNSPEWMQEFQGYHHDSYFSGIAIKLSDCGEAVKAFTFIG